MTGPMVAVPHVRLTDMEAGARGRLCYTHFASFLNTGVHPLGSEGAALPEVPKTLGERVHVCLGCGFTADRDENAARNILVLGTGNRLGRSRQAVSPTLVGLA